jgi:hypothetical protein
MNASQESSIGVTIRLPARCVIFTFFTESGKAMALGMRTACVLLVLKTVDWVMEKVYTCSVYNSRLVEVEGRVSLFPDVCSAGLCVSRLG